MERREAWVRGTWAGARGALRLWEAWAGLPLISARMREREAAQGGPAEARGEQIASHSAEQAVPLAKWAGTERLRGLLKAGAEGTTD